MKKTAAAHSGFTAMMTANFPLEYTRSAKNPHERSIPSSVATEHSRSRERRPLHRASSPSERPLAAI